MASTGAFDQSIEVVVDVTSFTDRGIITNALQANNGDPGSVILEYLESADKVGPPVASSPGPAQVC